jgi:hypothetical protein
MPGTSRIAEASCLHDDCSEKSGVRATAVYGSTRLRFERCDPHCVITVEAPVHDDLIPKLYRLLIATRTQVVRVHAQVLGDRTLHELDVVEFDGSPLPAARWGAIQAEIVDHLGTRLAPQAPELSFTRQRLLTNRFDGIE